MTLLYLLLALLALAAPTVVLFPTITLHEIPRAHRWWFAMIVSTLFLIGSFGLYQRFGAPEILPLLAERQAKMDEVKQAIIHYSQAVQANSQDVQAWIGLGQSFVETGQYHAASNAFKQAILLTQGDPTIILAYAHALILDAGGKVTDEAKKSLDMVILQQPDDPLARYFLALRLLQDGRPQDAMPKMKALYRSLPEDSPVKEMIDRQIGRNK